MKGDVPNDSATEWMLPFALDGSANPFRDRYGRLSASDWCQIITEAETLPIIDGLEFPHLAPRAVQEQTHGQSGAAALKEAADFYKFVAAKPFFPRIAVPTASFLDFGTGWGRIARFFLRDFDLSRLFAFEPQRTACFLARRLNPYLCVFTGGDMPDQTLPPARFDLVVGWSVFSHLSEVAATAWLEELARITRPNAYCVMSTFGERFLGLLETMQAQFRDGREIHWYFENCLKAAGDIAAQRRRHQRGDFVWLGDGPTANYGQAAILSEKALLTIFRARQLPFDLVEFDHKSLGMDVFTIRRR
jgi:SAM-dependent methyltransferase